MQQKALTIARSPSPLLAFLRTPWFALVLITLLCVMVGMLAYQSPANDSLAVGWIGDQLFLATSAGLGQDAVERGDWYADSLTTDSPTGRSRWSRQHAVLTLPNIGSGFALDVTLLMQGWPDDVLVLPRQVVEGTAYHKRVTNGTIFQPTVTLRSNGTVVGIFSPTTQWEEYTFHIPASARTSDDLVLEMSTSAVFTDTRRGPDARPKGMRLAGVRVQSPVDDNAWTTAGSVGGQFEALLAQVRLPAWDAVATLVLVILLFWLLLKSLLQSDGLIFVLAALAAGLSGAGLALARIWMGALLSVVVVLLLLALVLVHARRWLRLLRLLLWYYRAGWALNDGLMVAAFVWMLYALTRGSILVRSFLAETGIVQEMFPDSLLAGLLGMCLLALVLVLGREGLPRLAERIVHALNGSRSSLLIALLLGAIWIGYEAWVIAHLPYVGHADYADNAVVARNLVAGRGWVVDYVTQFYQVYESVTRPQETWPLLQPVWIAPFVAVFGPQAWAVKVPNLLFNVLLLVLVFTIGSRVWDRRVGLVAALLVLTNHLFFTLTIYATSDLAFVVFVTGAVYLLYRAVETKKNGYLTGAGALTGLMLLQKPSGALIAVGMGVWLLMQLWQQHRQGQPPSYRSWWGRGEGALLTAHRFPLAGVLVPFGVWAAIALLILIPYMLRNMALFHTPVYSTERYDAWVLGYRGNSDEAWSDIYRVYAPELGGDGLPDRSWILRWGFDQTWEKFRTQVQATRNYLMPAWGVLPGASADTGYASWLLSQNENKNLLPPPGAWFSLLGVLAALRVRRRLLSLLSLAFVPYTLFLLTYWHANEERYWLMLIPWLALLAAWVLWAGYDRLAAIQNGRWTPVGLILVVLAISSIIGPSWPIISYKVQKEPAKWAADLAAYAWVRAHTPPDAVLMTRNPWQLNWHAERAAVMIPNTSNRDMLLVLAEHYHVDYMVFDSLQRVKSDAARVLAPLINAPPDIQVGDTIEGFTLVYASPTPDNRVLIYRVPESP